MDQATALYRHAMIEPRTGGRCRYCGCSVDDDHTQTSSPPWVFCGRCHQAGRVCGGGEFLMTRKGEREIARVTR